MTSAESIIDHLNLAPHPEGGWYRQTWIAKGEGRTSGSAIYYLLEEGQRSHWHRIDSTEIWYFHAGAPLVLSTSVGETAQWWKRCWGRMCFWGNTHRPLCPFSIGRPPKVLGSGHW